jgi:HAD superfamily phosphatase (TIGR01668 family)
MAKKSLEDRIMDFIFSKVNAAMAKVIKPDMEVDNVGCLNVDEIRRLKKEYGIKGIILDIDETVRSDMGDIPKVNQEWINMIKDELKVIVVSNGIDKKVERYFELLGIDYIGFAHKPFKKNFIKACEKMGLEPEKTLVIGDSLWCDIFGGQRNQMRTALVKNVDDEQK